MISPRSLCSLPLPLLSTIRFRLERLNYHKQNPLIISFRTEKTSTRGWQAPTSSECGNSVSSNGAANNRDSEFELSLKRSDSSIDEDESDEDDPIVIKAKRLFPREVDLLMENLQRSKSIDDLCHLIDAHLPVMNNRHICKAFKCLDELHNTTKRSILSIPSVRTLCERTLRVMRFFSTEEAVSIIECLVHFNAKTDSPIFQAATQMIRRGLMDLDVNQIITVDEILQQCRKQDTLLPQKVPLTYALQVALPLLLQIKIQAKEYDFNDISSVIKAFKMCLVTTSKLSIQAHLLKILKSRVHELDNNSAVLLLKALTQVRNIDELLSDSTLQILLEKSFDVLCNALDQGDVTAINDACDLLPNHLSSTKLECFYNERFYNSITPLIVERMPSFGLDASYGCLKIFRNYGHLNMEFLDCFVNLLTANEEAYQRSEKIWPTTILHAYELANYDTTTKPEWPQFVDALLNNRVIEKMGSRTPLKLLGSMVVLKEYRKLHELESRLESVLSRLDPKDLESEPFVNSIMLLNAGFTCEHVCENSRSILNALQPFVNHCMELIEAKRLRDDHLGAFIGLAFGGKHFFVRGVWTEPRLFVDYLIVLRKGGFPMSIKQSKNRPWLLDDIAIPSDALRLAVIPLDQSDYNIEPPILKGTEDFRLRVLEGLGIITVPIDLVNWRGLSERERVPFLMQEIRSRCDLFTNGTNNELNS